MKMFLVPVFFTFLFISSFDYVEAATASSTASSTATSTVMSTTASTTASSTSSPATASSTTSAVVATTTKEVPVKERVHEYFADIPVMIEIARCESNFRQFTDSGSVLYGGWDDKMVGIFQLYENVHINAAIKLGLDLSTVDGNLAYARHLYEEEGTSPWNSSKHCWESEQKKEKNTVSEDKARANLEKQIELLMKVVELLKQLKAMQA